MNIERFQVPGLAHYSYILSGQGKAVVVDPMRDVETYLRYAQSKNLEITHVLETHIHADYASGATALSQQTGAELWLSAHDAGEDFEYGFPHHAFADGDVLEVGDMQIRALHTPGHTPEHLSFLVFDRKRNPDIPGAFLTGDFLFVGSLGRPDLLGEEAKQRLAKELYHSLQERIADLPDGLEIHPGHGAGSLCGSGMSERSQSTLGYERAANPFFGLDQATFVKQILGTVPPFPDYYRRMKKLNSVGAPMLDSIPGAKPITPGSLRQTMRSGQLTLLDVRRPEAFGGSHIAGSINIGAGQNLSLWAGWMLDPERPIVLIGEVGDDVDARRSLIRVGLDNIAGHLSGGIAAWIDAGYALNHIPQLSVHEVGLLHDKVLDVRSDGEWGSGHIEGADHIMLGDLPLHLEQLDRRQPVIAVCGSGYRSSIAASMLEANGFAHVRNMAGGMGAWNRQQLPVV